MMDYYGKDKNLPVRLREVMKNPISPPEVTVTEITHPNIPNIIYAIKAQTGLDVSPTELHKLNNEPIQDTINVFDGSVFDAYAAQVGMFGIHVYCYGENKIIVHRI